MSKKQVTIIEEDDSDSQAVIVDKAATMKFFRGGRSSSLMGWNEWEAKV